MARLPDQIGKYNVVERIGKGGMGMVYKAEHPTLDRFVILKKLNISGDQVIRERFRREAEIMIDFRTDYVVDVYDHFRHGSNDYIVLEYVDGVSLDELLARERYLESDLALLVIRDVLRGLEYVHSKGVVHRDVKPGNVLIGRDGSVKLLDFGIASRGAGTGEELTQEGMTLGTVAYIAPEQIERSRDVDRRADVYSAGATFYEMVTGRKPFTGGFTPETVNRIQRGTYRRPRRVNPRVSRFASRLITRSMQRKPRRRYQRAADAVRLIDAYFRAHRGRTGVPRSEDSLRARLAELAGGPAVSGGEARRRRVRWGRIAVAIVLLLAVAAGAGWVTGAVQRLVLRDTHSLVRIEVRLRKGDRLLREHLIRTTLERDEAGELVPIPLRLPLLRPVGSLETPDYLVLRSRLFTLPAGRYRSTFTVEDTAVRRWASLAPISLAQERRPEEDAQLLAVQWDPLAAPRVELELRSTDAYTDVPLTGVVYEAFVDDQWLELVRRVNGWYVRRPATTAAVGLTGAAAAESVSGAPEGREQSTPFGFAAVSVRRLEFEPGGELMVRASHPGYLTEELAIATAPLTEQSVASFALVPRPGTLLVNSPFEEATIRVNGRTTIPVGGRRPAIVDTPPVYRGVTELELVPGSYLFEFERDGQTGSVRVTLGAGQRATIRLREADDRIDVVIVEEPS